MESNVSRCCFVVHLKNHFGIFQGQFNILKSMNKINKLIRIFFSAPRCYKELKNKETKALYFVAIAFLITFFCLSFVFLNKLTPETVAKNKTLTFIQLLNAGGFLYCSIRSFILSQKAASSTDLLDLEKIKKNYYRAYSIFVGFPFLSMTGWLLFDGDIFSSILMFLIFIVSLTALFFDWKEFRTFKQTKSNFLFQD